MHLIWSPAHELLSTHLQSSIGANNRLELWIVSSNNSNERSHNMVWLEIMKGFWKASYYSAVWEWEHSSFEEKIMVSFLAHLAQSASWGIVRGLTPASVVVCRQQLLQRSSSPKLLGQFLQYFTWMFHGWSSLRLLKIMTPGSKMAQPEGLSVCS